MKIAHWSDTNVCRLSLLSVTSMASRQELSCALVEVPAGGGSAPSTLLKPTANE